MVEINNLSFGYKKSKESVLQDFSLTFEKGKIYGLLGKNGVGKSTLLYLMAGLLTPQKGNVIFHEVDVRNRLPITLNDMFIIPEEFNLPNVSLSKYIELNGVFYPRFSKADMIKHLSQFEMAFDINLGALSMGQKKKVFMSFALATNTSLLMMDEPTNGLDIPGKSQFRKLIASGMSDERTIIISTHQVRDIDKALDHVIIMNDSKVLFNESVIDICQKLLFKESNNNSTSLDVIYSLPSLQGKSLMLLNAGDEESDINLELLFGAVLENAEKLNNIFHSQIKG
ncbi:MAG: ABC transporter ATP-binding protein [Muribaculaceae bacterium]